MTDDYLTMNLEEANLIAEHDWVARTTDNQAHAYLRYAVLRILEGQKDPPSDGLDGDRRRYSWCLTPVR